MPVLVFGHRNPDTDAICSAIAYADFLQKTTRPDASAACCGPPNERTEFALKIAGLKAPRIVMDVRPEVDDVCRKDVVVARESEVFFEVYQRLKQHSLRAIPVVNESNQLVGVLSLLDLLEVVFHGDAEDAIGARQVTSSLDKINNVLGGRIEQAIDPHQREELLVMVGAMSAEGFTKRLKSFPDKRLLVVSGDRPTIQLPAVEYGVRGLVVTGGYELSPGLLKLAKANGVSVIYSPYDTATTTMRIKTARSIESAIQREFVSLSDKQPIYEARRIVERSRQAIFPVVNDAGTMVGVLSKSDLINPPKPQLILVDHNEIGQAVEGAEEAEIIEVLDHHRLGGSLKSSQPIRFINEPVGSTCTLVARQYRAAGIEPSAGMALCMASGIISDTLYLRSPTTTDVDRSILDWLRQFCKCDLTEFSKSFFEVGSALRKCEANTVVREDCKQFDEHGQKFSISQIEEIGFDLFWNRKEELQQALAELTISLGVDFSALLVTDIVSNGSLLLMSREPEGWEEINYPRVDVHLYKLDNVVSRKKQLLPLISQLLDLSHADAI
jgi:manganese-dependent inorganic pyrophosphatase